MVCNAGSTAISNGLYMFVYPEPLLSLNGPTSACVNSTGHLYTTEPGMTNYAWSISGGTITAGGGAADHNAVVTWTDVGQQTISINYANPQGCSARVPVQLQVDVTSGLAPGWPGVVNGPSYVAFNQTKTYSVAPVSNALGYVWQIPPGTVMISGANTNTIVVDFPAATATSGPISVHGVNSCGNGPASPVLMVTLGPAVPDTVYLGNLTFGSGMTSCFNALETIIVAGQGTWFSVENGASVTLISGKRILIQPTTHLYTGAYFHAYITPDHQYCGSLPQSMVAVNTGGESFPEIADDPHFRVWPNPTGGEFTLEVTGLSPQERTCFEMYDLQGVRIRDFSELTNGSFRFSLNDKPRGLYLIKLVHASGTDLIRLIKD
jgi:hypothetical protein